MCVDESQTYSLGSRNLLMPGTAMSLLPTTALQLRSLRIMIQQCICVHFTAAYSFEGCVPQNTNGITFLEVTVNLEIHYNIFLGDDRKVLRKGNYFFYIHTKILHGQIMPLNYTWSVLSATIDFVLCFEGVLS